MREELDEKIQSLLNQYEENKLEKKKLAFNLFNLSTYGNQLENFHSDLLAHLFNPNGLHNEKGMFLDLFLKHLQNHFGIITNDFDFKTASVEREKGRIDIAITDYSSNQAVLIENKINDAVDQDRQLDRYFEYKQNHQEIEVKAIVYLTLDGIKIPPPTENDIGEKIVELPAFTDDQKDLVSFLSSCYPSVQNVDTAALLNQYVKLLKFLNNKVLDEIIVDSFYLLISNYPELKKEKRAVEILKRIPAYRGDQLLKAMNSYAPFKKYSRYKDDVRLFEGFKVKDNYLKLDVVFDLEGSAKVIFWNTTYQTIEGREILKEVLNDAGILSEFDQMKISNGGNGYIKVFSLDEFDIMSSVDIAVTEFINKFLNKISKNVQG